MLNPSAGAQGRCLDLFVSQVRHHLDPGLRLIFGAKKWPQVPQVSQVRHNLEPGGSSSARIVRAKHFFIFKSMSPDILLLLKIE